MTIDVIMLSGSFDDEAIRMTKQSIETLRASETNRFNIILVESHLSKEQVERLEYDVDFLLTISGEFNYNAALNLGASKVKNDVVIISNNDVVFYQGWLSKCLAEMHNEKLDTASPFCPGWQPHDQWRDTDRVVFGWKTSYEFCGWCLVFRRQAFDAVLPFDETFDFWHQDNDLAKTLEFKGFKHGLVTGAKVRHLASRSHKYFSQEEINSKIFSGRSAVRFAEKWKI